MSIQKEKSSIIDPAYVEDAKQALAQLSPEEQKALGAKTAYVMELLRQKKSAAEIIEQLSKNDPLFKQAAEHLGRIPEQPVKKE
jgi:hypothetical protein